ncbi:MAG: serine/threonine protein kinase [Roseibacillus sp.]
MSEERYEIRGKIGQGGVGAVYRAYDRNLNREVAIKRVLTEEGFDPNDKEDEATKALLKEAVALCSVQHPHIVTVYDAGVDTDGPYVVMELLSGRTLDEMVERGTMTWPDFRETAVQCLEALIAAQELDLVHRDIKPSNVMVTWLPSGKFQVKLVDFGLAKFSAAPSLQTIDHGDAVFGSIHFMAPEQFERVPLDQRTDMYSLGCVFFFCLTGHYPFDGETAPLVMAAHLQNEFHKLKEYRPDLPDWVCQWVEWHIARTPDERPHDARESLERFLAFEQPVPQTAPVAVDVVSASSLPVEQTNQGGSGTPSRLTGPVPVLPSARVPAAAAPEGEVAAVTESAPVRAKLITGPMNTEPPAEVPVAEVPVAAAIPSEPLQGEPPTQSVSSGVKMVIPQAITPPEGAKPSIHTGAQVVRATTGPVPVHAAQYTTPVAPVTPEVAQVPPPPQPQLTTQLAAQLSQTSPMSTDSSTPTSAPSPSNQLKSAKGSGNAVRIAIAAVLGVAIIISGVLLMNVMGTSKKEKELQDLMLQATDPTVSEIPLSKEHLEGFLSASAEVDFDKDKGAVYQTLYLSSSTDGTNIDRRIAEFASTGKLNEQVRTKLFQVVGKRGDEAAVPYLLKFAKESKEKDAVVAAIDATGKNLSGRHLSDLYKLISSSPSVDVRGASERAVKRYLVAQTNNSPAAKDLVTAFKGSMEKGPRETFLRLLGATGAPEAAEAVEEALSSSDNSLKVSAYAALANWRDDSLFEQHIGAMRGENETFLRSHAFDSVISFLKGDAEYDDGSEKKMWQALSKELKDSREKKEFISILARGSENWAMALIEPLTKDSNDDTSFLAEKALEAMERRK